MSYFPVELLWGHCFGSLLETAYSPVIHICMNMALGPVLVPLGTTTTNGLYCQYTVQSLHEAPEALVLHVPAQIDLLLGLQ